MFAWNHAEAWIYEPGSFIPVAKVSGEELWYVTTDHLGTPRELFSEDGQRVVWRADPGLWGRVEPDVPVANDDRPPASCAIRFQGQWEDEESGLHYNRFRYYDPEATQYLSPDPIGLAGGVRPQGYVADPNGWVDPLGLAGCPRRLAGRVIDRARKGKVRRAPDYHGRLPDNVEANILSNPDGVYTADNGNLMFHKGENVVITHGNDSGSIKGQVLTSYGPDGPRGDSGAAIFGGSPTDPGMPVTADMITNGEIPRPDGTTFPPATPIDGL